MHPCIAVVTARPVPHVRTSKKKKWKRKIKTMGPVHEPQPTAQAKIVPANGLDIILDDTLRQAQLAIQTTTENPWKGFTQAVTGLGGEMLVQRVFKPVDEHTPGRTEMATTRVHCDQCARAVYRDECGICGRLFADHDPVRDGHHPTSAVRFDRRLLRRNVCSRHGLSNSLHRALILPMRHASKIVRKLVNYATPQLLLNPEWVPTDVKGDAGDSMNPLLFRSYSSYVAAAPQLCTLAGSKYVQFSAVGTAILQTLANWFRRYQKSFIAHMAPPARKVESSVGLPGIEIKPDCPVAKAATTTQPLLEAPRTVLDTIAFVRQQFSMVLHYGTSCQILLKSYYGSLKKQYPYLVTREPDVDMEASAPAAAAASGAGPKRKRGRVKKGKITGADRGIIAGFYKQHVDVLETLTCKAKASGSTSMTPDYSEERRHVRGVHKGAHLAHVVNTLLADLHDKTMTAIETCDCSAEPVPTLKHPMDFVPNSMNPRPGLLASDHYLAPVVNSATGLLEAVVVNPDIALANMPSNLRAKVEQVARGLSSNIRTMHTLTRVSHHLPMVERMEKARASGDDSAIPAIEASAAALACTCGLPLEGVDAMLTQIVRKCVKDHTTPTMSQIDTASMHLQDSPLQPSVKTAVLATASTLVFAVLQQHLTLELDEPADTAESALEVVDIAAGGAPPADFGFGVELLDIDDEVTGKFMF